MFAYFVKFKTFTITVPSSVSIELNFSLRVLFSNIFKQIFIKNSLQ